MRLAISLDSAFILGLAACSSSSLGGGGGSGPSKTYIIMPNGQATPAKPCGDSAGTYCP